MASRKLIMRTAAVVILIVMTHRPVVGEEPNSVEPSCQGSIIFVESGPSHCCWANTCGSIPRDALGQTYHYSDDCQWTNFHYSLGGCGSCN
jgi:hypothetical protein